LKIGEWIARITRLRSRRSRLVSGIRGSAYNLSTVKDARIRQSHGSRGWTAALLLAAVAVGVSACSGEFPQSTLHPTADFSQQIDTLYRTIFWWALGVFVLVEAALLFVIIRYRERPGSPAPRHIHGSTLLEVAWTLAPAVVLVFIAVPTIRTIFRTDGTAPEGALAVEVVGHQWWWEFHYPELGITTANEMHVPQGRPVALSMTSKDVIHSFWVPKLGGKRDVMPGRTTRIAFTPDSIGEVYGQCAEFCGDSHANMRFRVVVDAPDEFERWSTGQLAGPASVDSLSGPAQAGAQVFMTKGCLACHTIEGRSAGVLGPNLTHLASRSTIASGILPNDAEGLTRWLRDPPAEKPGSLMPKIPFTDDELAALVAYLRTLN
jgi:cytochrome c oxidase subunit 2